LTIGIARRRARPRWFTLLVASAVLTLLASSTALAFAPGPGTGNLDPYNPSNALPDCPPAGNTTLGNPITAGNANTINDGTCNPGLGSVTVHWITDTVSGSGSDNAWGQGDKSDCFLAKGSSSASGACVTQVFGIGASKTDLQYHGIGLAEGTNGHQYLYSGIKRANAGGVTSSNANYAVEVDQLLPAYQPAAPICSGTVPAGGGACNIWRSPGDLIFMTDWGGNSSSCNTATPAICAYTWIDFSTGAGKTPSPAGSTCFSAKAAPCWGLLPGANPALSANPDLAAGSIDAATSTFSEIGIDLTQSGLIPPGACETFNNVWAHSRSSSSFTAELKDFIFGNVSLSTCTSTATELHQRTNATGDTDVSPANNESSITVNAGAYVNDIATVTGGSATGTVAFSVYPSLTDCQNGTNATAAGSGIATSGGKATSSTLQFNNSGTFYWRAFFTGGAGSSDSSSACGDEILTVRQPTTTTTTLHERTDSTGTTDVTPMNNGSSITVNAGAWVNDVASVSPSSATGSVAFKVYPTSTDCTNDTNATAAGSGISVSSGSATSSTLQFNNAGTFYWRAFFTGGGLNNNSSSACGDEILTVRQPTTTSTTLHQRTSIAGTTDVSPANNGSSITVPFGAFVNDVATVSPSSATGSVSFTYYGSLADCQNAANGTAAGSSIAVSSGSATSSTIQFNQIGKVYWQAVYTATGNNISSSSTCGDEVLTIVPVNTAISTGPWYYPNDSATLSAPNGGGTLAGSIDFKLYDSAADCTANGATGLLYTEPTQAVSGPGPYNTTNTSVQVSTSGTVYWRVAFSSTNPAQNGRLSVCAESINATLTGDSPGTAP
jgi:hypothetical protein